MGMDRLRYTRVMGCAGSWAVGLSAARAGSSHEVRLSVSMPAIAQASSLQGPKRGKEEHNTLRRGPLAPSLQGGGGRRARAGSAVSGCQWVERSGAER